jgi:hypothetical protein
MIGSRRPEPLVEALEGLRQRGVLVDAREGSEDRRKAVILATKRAIRREKLKQRKRRWVFGGLSIAAAAALAIVVRIEGRERRHQESAATRASVAVAAPGAELAVEAGSVIAARNGKPIAIATDAHFRVAEGDSVQVAADGAALLTLPRGVRMHLSAATVARLDRAGESEQRLLLDLGNTFVSVPKPGGPQTVEIVTPNARVVVHGTEFTVTVARVEPSHSFVTTVSVTRGSVLVVDSFGQRLVPAGSSWSSAPPAVPPIETRPADSSEEQARTWTESSRRARRASEGSAAVGGLGEQNRLFQEALDLRIAGDDAASVRRLDEFLRRFPRSALEQEARFARLRGLSRLGRKSDAAAEARQYLSENPDTATRDEARRVLLDAAKPKLSPP